MNHFKATKIRFNYQKTKFFTKNNIFISLYSWLSEKYYIFVPAN